MRAPPDVSRTLGLPTQGKHRRPVYLLSNFISSTDKSHLEKIDGSYII